MYRAIVTQMEDVDKNLAEKYVLVIEDDIFLCNLLEQRFNKEKFSFFIAKDGEIGIEKVKEKKPDLVLLDVLLPGIDGYEVLKRIKVDPDLADIPVIILSNFGQKNDIEKAKQLGAMKFLVKATSDLDDIIKNIKNVLQGSEATS